MTRYSNQRISPGRASSGRYSDTETVTSSSEFDYISITMPHHRRSNSERKPEVPAVSIESPPWEDELDDNLEKFLPTSLIEEIVQPTQLQSVSLERFEAALSSNGVIEAKPYLNEILSIEMDPKEKGKIIRAAAEIAKRLSELMYALDLYTLATQIDPTSHVSWIDRAKLLEELGDYTEAERVLQDGILLVDVSEAIIKKLLKTYERTNDIITARKFLGTAISNPNFDKEFVLIEGALFELRQGNVEPAMQILNEIHRISGWRPNVYSEVVVFYEKSGLIDRLYSVVEEGAILNPRNSAVIQSLLRHQQDSAVSIRLLRENSYKWTAEFADKMTNTVCDLLASRGQIRTMRSLMAENLLMCSSKQRYKPLVTAAINELLHGDQSIAPLLLQRALETAPLKAKPLVRILKAKICELNGLYEKAEEILRECTVEYQAEWRVFLEYANFLVHRRRVPDAIDVLNKALETHKGSGRLWAFRVQLEAFNGIARQINVLVESMNAAPKSGEVWCEAARIALNPMTEYFSTEAARQYLEFAYRFTPQHGDTLVEMLRMELLERGPNADLSAVRQRFITSESNYGQLFLFVRGLEERPMSDVFANAVQLVREDLAENSRLYQRAIARASFVVPSVAAEAEKLRTCTTSPDRFVFGLSSYARLMTEPASCTREQLLSIVVGTASV